MQTFQEHYKRAAYADYELHKTTTLKNNISTTCRLLSGIYASNKAENRNPVLGLLLTSLSVETIFYLPNHFRQTVLVNSNNISFAKTDSALLELMNYMFKLNEARANEGFKIRNFLACY